MCRILRGASSCSEGLTGNGLALAFAVTFGPIQPAPVGHCNLLILFITFYTLRATYGWFFFLLSVIMYNSIEISAD